MEIYYSEVDQEVLIVRADGGLNAQNAGDFVNKIAALIDTGLTRIIVDCSKLDHITSAGMGTLMRLHTKMAQKGGNVKIACVKSMILKVLQLTRLDTVLEVYPDVNRARLAFRPKNA
ncbi:STAS domain-containing protein [Planctomycetota bacterium]